MSWFLCFTPRWPLLQQILTRHHLRKAPFVRDFRGCPGFCDSWTSIPGNHDLFRISWAPWSFSPGSLQERSCRLGDAPEAGGSARLSRGRMRRSRLSKSRCQSVSASRSSSAVAEGDCSQSRSLSERGRRLSLCSARSASDRSPTATA